jgi:hypothetical protein
VLPGEDAPERTVFDALAVHGLGGVAARLGRSPSDVAEAVSAAMLVSDHHEWVRFAADRIAVRGDVLWQNMCAEWATHCLPTHEANKIGESVLATIVQFGGSRHTEQPQVPIQSRLFPKYN